MSSYLPASKLVYLSFPPIIIVSAVGRPITVVVVQTLVSDSPRFHGHTISRSFLKLMSIESVMPSSHLFLSHLLLLLPSVFPNTKIFSNELTLHIRWSKYWSFSFSINASNEYLGLISFMIDWFVLLAVQGTLKSLLQHHSYPVPYCLCRNSSAASLFCILECFLHWTSAVSPQTSLMVQWLRLLASTASTECSVREVRRLTSTIRQHPTEKILSTFLFSRVPLPDCDAPRAFLPPPCHGSPNAGWKRISRQSIAERIAWAMQAQQADLLTGQRESQHFWVNIQVFKNFSFVLAYS